MQTIKSSIVPFSCFDKLKKDISIFAQNNNLNNFQEWIVTEAYLLEPKLDFKPRSIISVAVSTDLWNATFIHNGKKFNSIVEKSTSVTKALKYLSDGNNYQFFYNEWLPDKRIAVCSGLAEYGKNNICYVDGLGSLITLFTFISDMPAPKEYTWRNVCYMSMCENCVICQKNCPVDAILPNRFLIDIQNCMPTKNRYDDNPFPESIPKTAHHRTTFCSKCQEDCPQNKDLFNNIKEVVDFSEEETSMLLSGVKIEDLPDALLEKVNLCEMNEYYHIIPRNLKAYFESGNS